MADQTAQYSNQLLHLFCEDLRIEDNGKPMIIGILSPVVLSEDDAKLGPIFGCTLLTFPRELEAVRVELVLDYSIGGEISSRSYKQKLEKSEEETGETWSALMPVRINKQFSVGDSVTATITCEEQSIRSSLYVVARGINPD